MHWLALAHVSRCYLIENSFINTNVTFKGILWIVWTCLQKRKKSIQIHISCISYWLVNRLLFGVEMQHQNNFL